MKMSAEFGGIAVPFPVFTDPDQFASAGFGVGADVEEMAEQFPGFGEALCSCQFAGVFQGLRRGEDPDGFGRDQD